jgi:hypothetical protein
MQVVDAGDAPAWSNHCHGGCLDLGGRRDRGLQRPRSRGGHHPRGTVASLQATSDHRSRAPRSSCRLRLGRYALRGAPPSTVALPMRVRPEVLEVATARLACAGDSLAAAAGAALADLDGAPAGMPGLARAHRPANPAERQEAIAQAWRVDPGSPTPASTSGWGSGAETSSVTPRPSRSGASSAARGTAGAEASASGPIAPSTGSSLPGWPTNSGGPHPRRISAATSSPAGSSRRASVGGHGGRGLSSASLRLEGSALRQLVRHAGRPSWPPACAPPGSRHPRRRPSHPLSTSGCSLSLT